MPFKEIKENKTMATTVRKNKKTVNKRPARHVWNVIYSMIEGDAITDAHIRVKTFDDEDKASSYMKKEFDNMVKDYKGCNGHQAMETFFYDGNHAGIILGNGHEDDDHVDEVETIIRWRIAMTTVNYIG